MFGPILFSVNIKKPLVRPINFSQTFLSTAALMMHNYTFRSEDTTLISQNGGWCSSYVSLSDPRPGDTSQS